MLRAVTTTHEGGGWGEEGEGTRVGGGWGEEDGKGGDGGKGTGEGTWEEKRKVKVSSLRFGHLGFRETLTFVKKIIGEGIIWDPWTMCPKNVQNLSHPI